MIGRFLLAMLVAGSFGLGILAASRPLQAQQPCAIANSACYPWRIAAGARDTTLLTVVPNNAITGAIYRVCLCPPRTSVDLEFRFADSAVVIGRLQGDNDGAVCRDFRIETSRSSELALKRPDDVTGLIAGCYTSAASSP